MANPPAGRSPVVTGVGIVSSLGHGVGTVWPFIRAGLSGLKPLSLFQSPRYGQILSGEAQRDLGALGAPPHGSRSDQLGWLAAQEAIRSAQLELPHLGDRAGVVLGCSVGGSYDSERFLSALIKRGKMRARPTRFHECVSVVDWIAGEFGLFGPGMAVATACSSGALAIATAAEFIQAGQADVMLAGGADSLSRMTWAGFHSLLLVDPTGCHPFDNNRAGTSLGEGAGVLVLEAEQTARRRGAPILARLSGWGASCDAYHATAPHPEGAGAIAAMLSALRRAGLAPSEIAYVNAHGTATRDNDVMEARALKQVFGERLPPISSTKGFFGHALAASGALEAVVCIEALRHQELPPNPGFSQTDPAIGFEPVTTMRPAPLTHVMSNSFGFGGNNAVLIFSLPEAKTCPRPPRTVAAAVLGLGVIAPDHIESREIEPPLPPGRVSVHSCGALADSARLTSGQRRRLSRLVQMAIIASRRAQSPGGSEGRRAVAIGTGFGFLEDAGAFLENLIAKDESEPMPSRFPNSVHNAAAAQVAMDLDARGLNSAPTNGGISFESALWQAISQLAIDEADTALAGAVDELNKYPLSIGRRWGLWNDRTRPGEGAVVARLADVGTSAPRMAQVNAVRLGRFRLPFDAEREVDWICDSVDLATLDVLLSGANGWPVLNPYYDAVARALSARAGRTVAHQTYKERCGEFHSASAIGFSVAVDLVRAGCRGVLLYTLSARGAKALCCITP
jgi:3-oxoacyl-(acyl-carrier-protein) synthase